jgi:hypothetical protein
MSETKRTIKQTINQLKAIDPTVTVDPTPGWTLCTATGIGQPTVCGIVMYPRRASQPTLPASAPYFIELGGFEPEFRPCPFGAEVVFPASAIRAITTGTECAEYIDSLCLPYFDRVR